MTVMTTVMIMVGMKIMMMMLVMKENVGFCCVASCYGVIALRALPSGQTDLRQDYKYIQIVKYT